MERRHGHLEAGGQTDPASRSDSRSMELRGQAYGIKDSEHKASACTRSDTQSKTQTSIYRDKYGRKLDVKIEKLKEEKARRELEEAAADHMQWGRGIAQQESKKVRLAQLEAIKNEPFSRGADDPRMNAELKSQVLWDDPLKDTAGAAAGVAKIRNRGRGPPNRYGIVPGLQWDGIDRSNGYEEAYLERDNLREAKQLEAYKWRSEDM